MPTQQQDPLPAGGTNTIGHTIGLLGDEWTLLVVQQALLGATRYADFLASLPISHAVLTARLRTLTEEGVLAQRRYQDAPPRSAYHLTPRGVDLWRVLLSLWAWERAWVPTQADALPVMVHHGCGAPFAPVLRCAGCHRPAPRADLTVAWGPSGGWARSVPDSSRRRSRGRTPSALGLFPDTMAILGSRWSMALIGACFLGRTRFGEFERALHAGPAVVSDRVRRFVEIGVLAPDTGDRRAYRLTPKGEALWPTIACALAWGDRWYAAPEGPALRLTHTCGSAYEPELACDRCAAPLTPEAVRPTPT